jgi:hypothetical protein
MCEVFRKVFIDQIQLYINMSKRSRWERFEDTRVYIRNILTVSVFDTNKDEYFLSPPAETLEQLNNLKKSVMSRQSSKCFCFDKILPPPKFDDVCGSTWNEKVQSNRDRYGFDDIWAWRRTVHGAILDVGGAGRPFKKPISYKLQNGVVRYEFDTYTDPPVGIFRTLQLQYTDLYFDLKCVDLKEMKSIETVIQEQIEIEHEPLHRNISFGSTSILHYSDSGESDDEHGIQNMCLLTGADRNFCLCDNCHPH